MLPLFALLSVLACSGTAGPPPSPAQAWLACADPDCHLDALPDAWRTDEATVTDAIKSLSPIEQQAIIQAIGTIDAHGLTRLCPQLPADTPVRDTCERIHRRPHLGKPNRPVHHVNDQAPHEAPGPAGPHPTPPTLAPPGWGSATEAERAEWTRDCDEVCVLNKVRATASQGEAGMAARMCSVLSDTARPDCLFQAGEALAQGQRWHRLRDALALCAASGSLAQPCDHHVLARALPPAPSADAPTSASLAEMREADMALREVVGSALAPQWSQMAWSLWIQTAFRTAPSVTGDLLPLVPTAVRPHVTVSAAWRLLRLQRFDTLERAADALRTHLAVQGALSDDVQLRDVTLEKLKDYWERDLNPDEGRVPATWCMGPGRRGTSVDEHIDLRMALLEAAARQPTPPPFAFFRSGLDPSEPELVRWTAARLAATLYPEELAAAGITDESALVSTRLHAPPDRRGRRSQPR